MVAYHYERHAEMDLSGAPKTCSACGEPYQDRAGRQWLHACDCGGHMAYECGACGRLQLYPQLAMTCL